MAPPAIGKTHFSPTSTRLKYQSDLSSDGIFLNLTRPFDEVFLNPYADLLTPLYSSANCCLLLYSRQCGGAAVGASRCCRFTTSPPHNAAAAVPQP